MKHGIYFILLIAASFIACYDNGKQALKLVGEWHGVSWKSDGKEIVNDSTKLVMMFSKEGVYNLIFNSRVENGDWHVDRDTIYLVPEKTDDVKLKILELKPDKLKFSFNNGQNEIVEFKK